jgi:hypothetical protein
MDPFSIIGAVVTGGKTLFAITESILGFVDEVRTANQSIQGIYDEVDSLRRTLDAINHSLASSLLSNAIAGSQVTTALYPGLRTHYPSPVRHLERVEETKFRGGSENCNRQVLSFRS